jgi:2-methylisocitrate lyase-like PEP mutase family enzyme
LISREEAIGKFKAAVAAKKELDPDFVVCARCDSIGSEGGNFEDAVERSIAYVKEAGVDAIWVNTLTQREQIEEACRRIPAPVIAPYYGPRPSPTFDEFENWVPRRYCIRASRLRAGCKRPGNCFMNSNSAAPSCSTNGIKKPKPARGHGAAHSGPDSAEQEDFTTGRRVYSEGIAARL